MRTALLALLLAAPASAERTGHPELGSGSGSAFAAVRGPVAFTLRTYAAEVEVTRSQQGRVTLTVVDRPGLRVALVSSGGDRIEAEFDGKRQLHEGKVRVELPQGSSLDISAVSGSVAISGVGGGARVRGMSGEVKVAGATKVDVETVDGPIQVSEASGEVRIHTTSGSAQVTASNAAAKVEVETSSGHVEFRGPCGKDCHLDVDSVSGEARFLLDRSSSFSASVISTSGKVRDDLSASLHPKEGRAEGEWLEGQYGAGDGLIECETFSGNIVFRPR